jgi:long-chain acyl-CoA synthetase
MPGVECRLGADGEVQVKSPGAMLGYFRDAAATAEAFTADGFLRTGDLGAEDADGQLRITGRAKEPFKTTGGNYVAPAPIETRLRAHPAVGECCVCGSGLPQPYAVVVLSEAARPRLAAGDRPALEGELLEHLSGVNRDLARHEQLAFLAVVDDDWLPENGFLTPTLKVKRARVESAYGPLAPLWLRQGQRVVWKS